MPCTFVASSPMPAKTQSSMVIVPDEPLKCVASAVTDMIRPDPGFGTIFTPFR